MVAVTCSTSSSIRMDAQDNQKHNYESLSWGSDNHRKLIGFDDDIVRDTLI